MKRTKEFAVLAGSICLAAGMSFGAYADDDEDERKPVGHITLNIQSDIEAGDWGGDVEVTLEEGECSVDSVEIVNEAEYWAGGDEPKVEIWLSADSGYYFKKRGKSAFTFTGDEVKYVSSSAKNDREELCLTIRLEELDEDDMDLDVEGLYWDEENGIANWDDLDVAKNYKVRLCRDDRDSAAEEGIGSVYTVSVTSYDFSEKFPGAGSYYFKVRAFDSRDNAGEWQESSSFYVSEEKIKEWKGQWMQDARGWWYSNRDGSYTVNNWQEIGGKWYFFDQEGYMVTGWVDWNGKQYYCGSSGAMLVSTVTPDGFYVGADGARYTDGQSSANAGGTGYVNAAGAGQGGA